MSFSRRILSLPFSLLKSRKCLEKVLQSGYCSQLSPKKSEGLWSATAKVHDWNRAISDAERIVGYPTTFFSLKFLLSEEFSSIAQHLRKLLGTNHPILKTAKRLIYHGRTNMQTRGLVVLLMSKAAGHTSSCTDKDECSEHGITPRQQNLAEITEMIHTAHLVHKGILNLSSAVVMEQEVLQELQFGNKISILSGDYLLANACKGLANLRNCEVVDLISTSIADFMQSEFVGEHDIDGNSLPTREMDLAFWEGKNYLCSGSLMANSCKATLELAGHNSTVKEKGYEFGRNIGLAWQAYNDLQPFVDDLGHPPGMPFDFTSLPVIFHLQNHPEQLEPLRMQLGEKIGNFDYKSFHGCVMEGDAVDKTKDLLNQYSQKAEDLMLEFGSSAATKALSNIINSLKH